MHKFYDVVKTNKKAAPKAAAITLESFNADQYLLDQELSPMAQVVAIAEATYPALEAISEQAQNLAKRINDGETISKAEVASVKAFAAHVFHDELNMPKEESSVALEAIDDLAGDEATIALETIGETLSNAWATFKKWLAAAVSKFTGLFKKGGFLRKWFDKMISGISAAYQGVKSSLIGTKIKVSLYAKDYKDLKARIKAVNTSFKVADKNLKLYSDAVDKCLKTKPSDWGQNVNNATVKAAKNIKSIASGDLFKVGEDGQTVVNKGEKRESVYKVRPWSDFKANLDKMGTPSSVLDKAERLLTKVEALEKKGESAEGTAEVIAALKAIVGAVNAETKYMKEASAVCFQDLMAISVAVRGRKGDKKAAKEAAKEAAK